MSKLIAKLKSFTYCQCLECGSVHCMDYCGDCYMCEECYRTIDIETAEKEEDILIDYYALKSYILSHKTPKKVIKMFIVKIWKESLDEYDIDDIYNELVNNNKLFYKY